MLILPVIFTREDSGAASSPWTEWDQTTGSIKDGNLYSCGEAYLKAKKTEEGWSFTYRLGSTGASVPEEITKLWPDPESMKHSIEVFTEWFASNRHRLLEIHERYCDV